MIIWICILMLSNIGAQSGVAIHSLQFKSQDDCERVGKRFVVAAHGPSLGSGSIADAAYSCTAVKE